MGVTDPAVCNYAYFDWHFAEGRMREMRPRSTQRCHG